MNSLEIRNKFLDFFAQHGHEKVASSSLIPAQDPTLLFANAGMNQFKDLFLGHEKRSYTRATTIQKCVRAGGKHNDLDNVGFTKRHLTFFEMMGNFSFGDYFKKEAILYAWEFLTTEIGLDKNKLHPSVFETDDESYNFWKDDIGIPAERIHRLGAKDNFWQMGDVGPCGPCTEIYIDRETQCTVGDNNLCAPGCDCDRFLEIWNLVFMQFDRQADGTLKPLKQTGVDTGMGLERLCSVVQNQDTVFTTDLFMPIIKKIEELSGRAYEKQTPDMKAAFHVLADHIRSSSLIIADGCAPTNDGRGYVLRKIIRRAALFTQKLTANNIFPELSRVVIAELSTIYPELITNADLIYNILKSEIEKFAANLLRGNVILSRYLEETKETKTITGQQAFKLYDTYGFPIETIVAAAREHGYTVDMENFDAEMLKQQEQSGKKTTDSLATLDLEFTTEFTGYTELTTTSTILALVHEGQLVTSVTPGQSVYVITEKSPFFIVGGGQVPDQGSLTINGATMPLTEVRFINHAIAPYVIANTTITVGDSVTAHVDPVWRTNAMKNHTATHLLQAALIELFGKQIQQSGSLVHPDYLRFDFTYHQQLSAEDIKQVEDLVNEKIRANIDVHINYCTLKEAQSQGALAFFGEKYKPENVRVVKVDDFSTELCGGTHVDATGDIGTFKITESTALSAGHRRIFAVTGPKAIDLFQDTFAIVKTIGQDFKIKREEVLDAVCKQKEHVKELQHKIKQLKSQLIVAQIPLWQESTDYIHSTPFLFVHSADGTIEELRMVATTLEKKQPGFYFAISSIGKQTLFYTILSPEFAHVIDLKAFSLWLKDRHGLRGGILNNSIQGGGGAYNSHLHDAIKQWIEENGK
jgi:alanyl-tRNA synthetase